MKRRLSAFVLTASGVFGLGCAATQTAAPATTVPNSPASPKVAPPVTAASVASSVRERPELREYFQAEQVVGAIALFDSAEGSLSCSDLAICNKPTIPASTFKIAHSMIALETGVVDDAETVLPWDGRTYPEDSWNRNNTLRTAVRVSCVPCFQAIARKIGPERMQEWVTKLDYGNKDLSGAIDKFWLNGGLRISPLQQIDFLRRFDGGKLPISPRTAETVRDLLTLDVGQGHVLRGKTGLNLPPDVPELAAWFVGWLELGERRVFFATLINGQAKDVDIKVARRKVTERVLRALKLLPEDATRAFDG